MRYALKNWKNQFLRVLFCENLLFDDATQHLSLNLQVSRMRLTFR